MSSSEKSELAKKFGVGDSPDVSDVDTSAINSGPAIFANKIYATVMPQGLRLTFAEMNPAQALPAYRTAVLLSYPDAAALMDLLQKQLTLVESSMEQLEVRTGGENS